MRNALISLGIVAAGVGFGGMAAAQAADPAQVCIAAIAERETLDQSAVAVDGIETAGTGSVVLLSATNGENFECHVDAAGVITELEED